MFRVTYGRPISAGSNIVDVIIKDFPSRDAAKREMARAEREGMRSIRVRAI